MVEVLSVRKRHALLVTPFTSGVVDSEGLRIKMSNVKTHSDLVDEPGIYTHDRIRDMTHDEIRGVALDTRNSVSTNKWDRVSRSSQDATFSDSDRSGQALTWTD